MDVDELNDFTFGSTKDPDEDHDEWFESTQQDLEGVMAALAELGVSYRLGDVRVTFDFEIVDAPEGLSLQEFHSRVDPRMESAIDLLEDDPMPGEVEDELLEPLEVCVRGRRRDLVGVFSGLGVLLRDDVPNVAQEDVTTDPLQYIVNEFDQSENIGRLAMLLQRSGDELAVDVDDYTRLYDVEVREYDPRREAADGV